MKKIKIINETLMFIVFLMSIFCMLKFLSQNRYDLNNDGEVNSADLLYLRQYLIKKNEKESDK